MGLENDPPAGAAAAACLPLSPLTSVFRDGHAHFFAPLWRKRDVQEPINPACTCPRFPDTHSDAGSQPQNIAEPPAFYGRRASLLLRPWFASQGGKIQDHQKVKKELSNLQQQSYEVVFSSPKL